MKDKHFKKLLASVRQACKIKAGRRKPSRVFEMKSPELKRSRDRRRGSRGTPRPTRCD